MGLVTFALRIFDGLSKKQRAIQGSSQRPRGGDVAFQVCHDGSALNEFSVCGRNVASDHESNSNYPVQMGQGRRTVEIDKWHWRCRKGDGAPVKIQGTGAEVSNYGCGIVCHDGSYKLFKWDAAAGCMDRFNLSNPRTSYLKATLSGSFP